MSEKQYIVSITLTMPASSPDEAVEEVKDAFRLRNTYGLTFHVQEAGRATNSDRGLLAVCAFAVILIAVALIGAWIK